MIPLKLTLSNFLCYRENVETLDFAGVHVACLCGANGHGKSALLDSITWALWGKARGKVQDEMISYALMSAGWSWTSHPETKTTASSAAMLGAVSGVGAVYPTCN